MFDTRWAKPEAWGRLPPVSARVPSAISRDNVDRVLYMVWQEHCVECAVPECYQTCSLYVARDDGNCARFSYGIYPNRQFLGQFDFGADIQFRRWGKLEAALGITSVPIPVAPHGAQERFSRLPLWIQNRSARMVARVTDSAFDFDEFVLECYSPSAEPFKLTLTYDLFDASVRRTMCRQAFDIRPGPNFFSVPFKSFGLTPAGFLSLYPEESASETRLVFSWLDFVKFKNGRGRRSEAPGRPRAVPAAHLKCVAWDLDGTLWNGTLVETEDPASLVLRPGVLDVIRALDERGVIQTVISRNEQTDAWKQIERLGLSEYFVYPAINWGQKSENLRRVAARINIGLDTFALVDDSMLQRSEVQAALPQVRVYSDADIPTLVERPELDLPITEASRTRRLSYLASMRKEEVQAAFDGSYEDFLLNCQMEVGVFPPRAPEDVLRCWELVQRTNQLNLSGRRYSLEQFTSFVADPPTRGLAIDYKDKFGDYGIVGFASVDASSEPPALVDFVLSCRVAQQRVEHSFLKWLAESLRRLGRSQLRVELRKTARNGPLRQVFSDLPFEIVDETDEIARLTLDLSRELGVRDLARITADAGALESNGPST